MSSYLEKGFTPYFEHDYGSSQELSSLDQDAIFSEMSGSKILGGVLGSVDKKTSFDLNQSIFKVNDGVIDRVLLGRISENEYGLRIIDRDGNILFDITGNNNIIQSPDKKLQLDLTNKQLRVYDQTNLRLIIGELP